MIGADEVPRSFAQKKKLCKSFVGSKEKGRETSERIGSYQGNYGFEGI